MPENAAAGKIRHVQRLRSPSLVVVGAAQRDQWIAVLADVDYATMEGGASGEGDRAKRYSVMLTQDDGQRARFSFNTTGGWQVQQSSSARKFIARASARRGHGEETLDLSRVTEIGVGRTRKRISARLHDGRHAVGAITCSISPSVRGALALARSQDVICAVARRTEGDERERVLKMKRDGERVLLVSWAAGHDRRPGELVDEAGA